MDTLTAPEVVNPYQGSERFTLDLRCAGDARAVLEERLELLDLSHDIGPGTDGGLQVVVQSAAQPAALARLLTASPDLAFLPVAEDQTLVLPRHDRVEEAALDAVPGLRPDVAFDPDAIHALLEGGGAPLPPVEGVRLGEYGDQQVFAAPAGADWSAWLGSLPLLPGAVTALECYPEGEARRCSPVLLEGPATVTAGDIVDATLKLDPQFGLPYLSVTFSPAGAEAFSALSARLVGRELGIVSEGQLLSRPRVMETIDGGRASITMGLDTDGETLRQLWRIYTAVATGPLPGGCSVAEGPP